MKKQNLTNLIIAAVIILFVTACGGGIKSDAKKAAELACKAQKMALEMDMNNMEELQELQVEAAALYEKMEGKYETAEEMQEFAEAFQMELGKCE
jgi:hypothetical protein